MRLLRTLLLLGVGALIAAMTIAAPSAAAEETGVEIRTEPGQEQCPPVVMDAHEPSGGCEISAQTLSSAVLYSHAAEPDEETPVSFCSNQFDANVGVDGDGYIHDQQLSGANCGVVPCDEATGEALPWEFEVGESPIGSNTETLQTTFCIRSASAEPGDSGTSCEIGVALADAGDHEYQLSADEAPCLNLGGAVEVSGTWEIEGTGLELEHLDDV